MNWPLLVNWPTIVSAVTVRSVPMWLHDGEIGTVAVSETASPAITRGALTAASPNPRQPIPAAWAARLAR